MERKQFLIYVATATGLLPLLITQIGCAYDAPGAEAEQETEGSTAGFKVVSSRDNFHRHEIMILFADVSQPPAGGKTITSSGPIHTHDVVLGMADYQALQDGEQVVITSTFASRHSHTFAIQVSTG
ncbi:MAG: hypothetical protein IH971_08140 [Candidatus Marinimicrobia bacterium]|nr:hypothetical protein [Candidatus Neomarinimicrobiota bacterium]